MFPATITITNLATRDVAVDAKFSEDRALRRRIARGTSITLPADLASVDELDRNAQLRQLIDDGDITITMTDGPIVARSFTVAADAATTADTLVLASSMPFAMQITQIRAVVPTGVASSTVTLASAASGGVDYSAAIDTDGTPASVIATLTASATIAAGSALVLNRSATAKAALTLQVEGIRQSI